MRVKPPKASEQVVPLERALQPFSGGAGPAPPRPGLVSEALRSWGFLLTQGGALPQDLASLARGFSGFALPFLRARRLLASKGNDLRGLGAS